MNRQGLFSSGDRFIPFRADETWNSGPIRFYHEETLLLSRQAKKEQRRRRRDNSNSESSRSRSRGSSRSHSNSDRSEDSSKSGTHASRQMRQNYNHLLQESCFGNDNNEPENHFENLSMIDASSNAPTSTTTANNTGKTSYHGPAKHHSSSINMRSKGILRYNKPLRKMRSSGTAQVENENQRTGLNSILRTADDIQMTSDLT